MPLDKIIKFNHDSKRQRMPCIKFKNLPISIKSFTIKSSEKIYYNILINGHYLIYFPEYEDPYEEEYQELNEKYLKEYNRQTCISSEYDNIDGYHNYFKFDTEIYIESIEIENLHLDLIPLDDVYFEYDNSDIQLNQDEIENKYFDSYNFTKKYFKFINVPEDYEIKLDHIYDGSNLRFTTNRETNKRSVIKKIIPKSEYIFKHYKGNTYYVQYEEEQFKKMDNIYKFNDEYCEYISSYYPII